MSINGIKKLLKENPDKDLLDDLAKDSRKGVFKLLLSYHRNIEKAEQLQEKTSNLYKPLIDAKKEGFLFVGGIDEAGRGPLAGPVVAACVIIPLSPHINVDDSKKLSEKKRDALFEIINKRALGIGIGIVEADEIDRLNIYRSTQLAMHLAYENCKPQKPDFCFIDAMKVKEIPVPQKSLIKGDAICSAISAASIIAKVTRDKIMKNAAKKYSQYGFESHKGYGSASHMKALATYGPCPIHRTSFAPVSDYILPTRQWYETMLKRCTSMEALRQIGQRIKKNANDLLETELEELRETYTECQTNLNRH